MNAVLITGASGFVGQAALQALRSAAPELRLLLAGRHADVPLPPGCSHVALDLAAPAIVLPEGIDAVVHMAGEKRDTGRMDAVNHAGAARLADAAARAGATCFVHLGSVGVYGAPKHAGVVTEASARTPRNAYERSKNAGELAVRARCAALGLACTVLQPSNVFGVVPGRSQPLLGLVRMVGRGWFRYLGPGDAWLNHVAVEDVAAALTCATLAPHAGGVYIVNTPTPLRAVVGCIADALGRPAPTARLPLWLGTAAAQAGAAGRRLLGRDLPITPERVLELTNTTRYDGSAITRVGGLQFGYALGIDAAVRQAVRHYRGAGLV